MTTDQENAMAELNHILDQLAALGVEASHLVAEHFPKEIRWGDSYEVFHFGRSSNPHDATFEMLIGNLKDNDDAGEYDDDPGEDPDGPPYYGHA